MNAPRKLAAMLGDGKLYLLMVAATDDVNIDDAVFTIKDTWKWN